MKNLNIFIKRSISVFLSLLMVLSMAAFISPTAFAADLTVSDASGLRSFLTAVANGTSYSGKTVVLSADIDLGNQNMSGVQSNANNAFQGTFDGQGYTIKNFYLSAGGDYWGLFRYTAGNAVIKNLNFENVNVSGSGKDVGAVVGYAGGSLTMSNVHVHSGSVTGSGNDVGGLVGIYKETSSGALNMTDCSNAASVSGGYCGGLVGYSESKVGETFIRCYNAGTVTASAGSTGGGLFGYFAGTKDSSSKADWVWFQQCFNAGAVSGGNYMGGIIGYIEYSANSEFDQCFNWGNVSSGYMAGGIFSGIGNNAVDDAYEAYIYNLYNAGTISAGSGYAYDIGWTDTGKDGCYNCGTISSSNNRKQATQWSASQMQNGAATISSAQLVTNTWGVKVGSTTYQYPIHSWYRNMMEYTLRFVDSASGTDQTVTKAYNSTFTVPARPSKAGYTYNNDWHNASNTSDRLAAGSSKTAGVNAGTDYVMTESGSGPKNSTTFNIGKTANIYTISYTLNDGTPLNANPTSYTVESAAITLNNPAKEGYSFKGWSGTDLSGDTNQNVTIPTGSTGNRTYIANWTINTYRVRFFDRNDNLIPSATQYVNHGQDAVPPEDPDGYADPEYHYNFDGWTGYTNITADTDIHATFTPVAHVYDQQDTDPFFLESAATCTRAAKYAYSCVCGAKSFTESFFYGDPTGHTYAAPADADWSWTKADGGYTASVTVSCEADDDTGTLTAEVVLTEDVAATAEQPGHKTYTATAAVGEGDKQQTFTATKTDVYYYVAVTPGEGVEISGVTAGEYEAGTVLTVTAAARTGYNPEGLKLYVDGAETENGAAVTVDEAKTITTNDLPKKNYNVVWVDPWGTVLKEQSVEHGWSPIMPIDDPADVRIEAHVWRFDHWDNGLSGGQTVSVTEDMTITALYTLTDEVAKYTVQFLKDDNYTVVSTAEYEYNAPVTVPGAPASTLRTIDKDYTFLGWTPEVASNVTADATYVATYETEAHARIYPVTWKYGEYTAEGGAAALAYGCVITEADLPAEIIAEGDGKHTVYNWADHLGNTFDHELYVPYNFDGASVSITDYGATEFHTANMDYITVAYAWTGNDTDGYTACTATMTCARCGQVLTETSAGDNFQSFTEEATKCTETTTITYKAMFDNANFNTQWKDLDTGVMGPHRFVWSTEKPTRFIWNTDDPANVTCTASQECYWCTETQEEEGSVSEEEKTDATCVAPEITVFKAEFETYVTQYSDGIETAPVDPDAHEYGFSRVNEAATVRPEKDEATGEWSKGELHVGCRNTYNWETESFDASHDKVIENVDRADYTAFDEAYEKLAGIAGLDIAPDTVVITIESPWDGTQEITFAQLLDYVTQLQDAAADFPQNYTTTHGGEFDEQFFVDEMTEQMRQFIDVIFNADGTPKEELLNKYTVTFTLHSGSVTTYENKVKGAQVEIPEAPDALQGRPFLGWTDDGDVIVIAPEETTYVVTGDAAFTAKYAETAAFFTVTFILDGVTVKAQVVPVGGSATAPERAEYVNNGENHKHFSGWIGDYTNVTADVTVTATYTAEDHVWEDGEVTLTPTCSEKGSRAQSCVCGAANEKELDEDPANHADYGTETVNAVEAKCNLDGYTGDTVCAKCGALIAAGDVISKETAAHTPGEAVHENETDATCTVAGSYDEVVTCTVCGREISRTEKTIPPKGHDFGEWAETTAPTCTGAGVGTRGCTRCDLEETRPVAALGHSWGEWVVVTAPTAETEGLRRRVCLRCNAAEEEILPCSGEKNRKIQFVVSGNMHYVAHLSGVEYEIYSKSTPVLNWYENVPLTFDVVTHYGWGDANVIVSINGEELRPNADGSYTIPGGTDFVMIHAYPHAPAQEGSGSGVCNYCGKVHPNTLWGRLIAFFHLIFHFFKTLFKN